MAPSPDTHDVHKQRWWDGHLNELGLLLALLALVIVFSLTAPNFLTDRNLVNILRAASYVGIIALGIIYLTKQS